MIIATILVVNWHREIYLLLRPVYKTIGVSLMQYAVATPVTNGVVVFGLLHGVNIPSGQGNTLVSSR